MPEDFIYYYTLPEPPVFLVILGLFIGVTSGAAFEASLKQKVQEWLKNPYDPGMEQLSGLELRLPFLGICCGICLFLGAGLEIFSVSTPLALAISLPLTLFTGYLVWSQLGKQLQLLYRGGSQAMDLDSWE
ncbi:MAG: hypothetical protein HC890_08135 [Chloroflexaceae bacterium]|nr:hypothetical protein [Chloroflexaceae bacterium]